VHCFEHCSLRFHRTALVFDFSDSCEYCGSNTEIFSLKDSVERLSCKLIRKQFPFQRLTVGYPIGLRPASLPVTVIRSRSLLDAVHWRNYSVIPGLRIYRTPVRSLCMRTRPEICEHRFRSSSLTATLPSFRMDPTRRRTLRIAEIFRWLLAKEPTEPRGGRCAHGGDRPSPKFRTGGSYRFWPSCRGVATLLPVNSLRFHSASDALLWRNYSVVHGVWNSLTLVRSLCTRFLPAARGCLMLS